MSAPPSPRPDAPAIWPKPPVILLAFALLGLALEDLLPPDKPLFAGGAEVLAGGGALILCGIGIALIAALTLMRAKTTVLPDRPSDALVTSGIFARSRNPIYVGFAVMLLGFGVMSGSIWVLLMTPLFMLYLRYGVIAREEAYLARRFGETYAAYRQKTRRWY